MEYSTEEYIVAFVDILGATEKIKKDVNNSLNVVHQAYDEALRSLDEMFSNSDFDYLKPNVKIFSDNIVVAINTKFGKALSLISVIGFVRLLQAEFLYHGYLIRGGIAIGSFFLDNTMIWGEALTKAYDLESKVAVYPRVVIHPEIVSLYNLESDNEIIDHILQDIDGLFFVDYLGINDFSVIASSEMLLNEYLSDCNEMLNKYKDSVIVKQKIQWHYKYLQSCITKLSNIKNYILNSQCECNNNMNA